MDAATEAAQVAFDSYKKVNPRQRAQWLLKWHNLITENKDDLAKIVTHECGKPIAESLGISRHSPKDNQLLLIRFQLSSIILWASHGGSLEKPREFSVLFRSRQLQAAGSLPSSNLSVFVLLLCHGTFQSL